jgi:hypothetical protein
MKVLMATMLSISALSAASSPAEVPLTSNSAWVARGRLLAAYLTEERVQSAQYAILAVERGSFSTNVVEVCFWAGTLRGELPRDAILVLEPELPFETSISSDAYAVGKEAWRGIISATDENWSRIRATPDAQLSDSAPDQRISRQTAVSLVRARLKEEHLYSLTLRLEVRRCRFGWLVDVLKPHPRDRTYFTLLGIYHVSDERKLLGCVRDL